MLSLVNDIHCVLENNNIIDAFFSVYSAQDCQVKFIIILLTYIYCTVYL